MSKAGSSKAFCLKIINWNSVTDHQKLNCLSLLQFYAQVKKKYDKEGIRDFIRLT